MIDLLPDDFDEAVLIGRLETIDGPAPILVRGGRIYNIEQVSATVSGLLEGLAPGEAPPLGIDMGPVADFDFTPTWQGGSGLLAPIDLQCVKAAGVTFAVSAIERVIEERARGDAGHAQEIRGMISERIGSDIRSVRPGSEPAERLKQVLLAENLWSQYLEVAIGPHAEVFTKGPVLSAVGWGAEIGVRSDSDWNNPEPEMVLICDSSGAIRGATLGNDVNLRDIEGRSALLLGKAKDNNASCALGPFIRLFSGDFDLDRVRQAVVNLEVKGPDNYRLEGSSSMGLISRDPVDLAGQAHGPNHQYPDGFALMLGTMFAPVEDRDHVGRGFTHKVGDLVKVSSAQLGSLENRVTTCDQAPPWTMGIGALMRNLSARGLLGGPSAA